jgi:hypothetical protein
MTAAASNSLSQLTLNFNQRWCGGRASYRPPNEVIRTADYEVAEIPDDNTARAFVTMHHYSRTYPAARFRIGMYRHGDLVGVAVFSHPCSNAVLTGVFHQSPVLSTVELGRFVLEDSVPGNGESWFIARCFESIRKRGIVGVVSFSDPLPRTTLEGEVIHLGHYGGIYQCSNGVYLGRGTARTLRVLPDGRVFSDRTAQKIRAGERGWRAAAAKLETFGVRSVPEDPGDRAEWLTESLLLLTRRLKHRGNHKYAWALEKSVRSQLPPCDPSKYPKEIDTLAA